MDWLKKNPEKVALIVVALVATGFGVKHLLALQGYASTFELPNPAKKGKAIPETPEALVEKSSNLLEVAVDWKDKKIEIAGSNAAKEVPLLRSVYIVEKNGKLFDLANPNTEPLRPPVPNGWILGNQLEILNPKILDTDSDSDGFSNLEEWQGKSEPLNKDSHPPYTDKLFFAARPQLDLTLRFAVNSNPDFQVVVQTRQRTITKIYRLGQSFPEGSQKFTLVKYNEKKDPTGGDQSELEVRDNENQKTVTLVLRQVVPWPVYAVEFEFPLGHSPEEQKFRVQEGNSFHLSLDPSTEYKLVSAGPDSATILKAGGTEPMTIRKRAADASAAGGAFAEPSPGASPAVPAAGAAAAPPPSPVTAPVSKPAPVPAAAAKPAPSPAPAPAAGVKPATR